MWRKIESQICCHTGLLSCTSKSNSKRFQKHGHWSNWDFKVLLNNGSKPGFQFRTCKDFSNLLENTCSWMRENGGSSTRTETKGHTPWQFKCRSHPSESEMLWSQFYVQWVRNAKANGAVPQTNRTVQQVATVSDIFLAWPDLTEL